MYPDTLSDAQAQCYLNRYRDLINAFGSTNIQAAKSHWISNGKREGRNPLCDEPTTSPPNVNINEATNVLNTINSYDKIWIDNSTQVINARKNFGNMLTSLDSKWRNYYTETVNETEIDQLNDTKNKYKKNLTDGMNEDIRNYRIQQNNIQIVGAIATATFLIAAIVFSVKKAT